TLGEDSKSDRRRYPVVRVVMIAVRAVGDATAECSVYEWSGLQGICINGGCAGDIPRRHRPVGLFGEDSELRICFLDLLRGIEDGRRGASLSQPHCGVWRVSTCRAILAAVIIVPDGAAATGGCARSRQAVGRSGIDGSREGAKRSQIGPELIPL